MILTANEENRSAVLPLLPDRLSAALESGGSLCLFDTDGENIAVSVLLARLSGRRLELLWLFTAEEERGRGRAAGLLQRLREVAERLGDVESVVAALPAENAALPLLVSAGFAAQEEPDIEYTAPVGALTSESLWRAPCATDGIVSLGEVSAVMLNIFEQKVREQGNPAGLPLPLKNAEYLREESFAAISGGEMTGVVLAERTEDGIELSALHAVSGGGDMVRKLLYAAGSAALQNCPPDMPFHFVAINRASRNIASMLLKNTDRRYICRLTMPVGEDQK